MRESMFALSGSRLIHTREKYHSSPADAFRGLNYYCITCEQYCKNGSAFILQPI